MAGLNDRKWHLKRLREMRAKKNQEQKRRLEEGENVEEHEVAVCFPASNDDFGLEKEFVSQERRAAIHQEVNADLDGSTPGQEVVMSNHEDNSEAIPDDALMKLMATGNEDVAFIKSSFKYSRDSELSERQQFRHVRGAKELAVASKQCKSIIDFFKPSQSAI